MDLTVITQVINTIQGEGINSGTPMTLVRFGNCNLNCSFCDTKWSNNITEKSISDSKTIDGLQFPNIINGNNRREYLDYIGRKNYLYGSLLITGGEPFLNQDFIIDMVKYIKPIRIEFETNGTIFPEKIIEKLYNYQLTFNISPKLNPKFYKIEKIYTFQDILNLISNIRDKYSKILNQSNHVQWKFVYSQRDEIKIKNLILDLNLMNSEVIIMPLTPDIKSYTTESKFLEDFKENCYKTLDFCMKNNYRFSPRLQTWLFNNLESKSDEYDDITFNK